MNQEEFNIAINKLSEMPIILENLINDKKTDIRYKPTPDYLSVLETVCHLRDIENEGFNVRIYKLINEDNSLLPDIDGAKLVIERNYNEDNIDSALSLFKEARNNSVNMLKNISMDKLDNEATLENVGIISLAKLLTKMIEHDNSHLDELENLK